MGSVGSVVRMKASLPGARAFCFSFGRWWV